mgnify:CR=1 FL=1
MKILLLTQVVPFPPHSGTQVNPYHLVQHLMTQHEVTLVTFTRNAAEEAQAEQLRSICAAVHTVRLHHSRLRDAQALAMSFLTDTPFLIERNASLAMHRLLARLVREAAGQEQPFDLVHVDQLHMAQFAERLSLPRLLDQHHTARTNLDCMVQQSEFPHQLFLKREQHLLQRYADRICSTFETVTAESQADRQTLLQVIPQPRDIPVIPIAVDAQAWPSVVRDSTARGILSLETMLYPAHVDALSWFAHTIYPIVRRAVSNTHLYVYSQQPGDTVRALPKQDATITVTDDAPDVSAYIADSACLVVPLRRDSGMPRKILEALAWGIPIVSTSVGYANIDLTPGEHLLVADTPSDFADAVTLLLQEPDFGARIAAAGRKRLLERYDWHSVSPAIDRVYQQVTTRCQAATSQSTTSMMTQTYINR